MSTVEHEVNISTLPPQLHLIVQYYLCATPGRQAEIDTCLRKNLQNPHIDALHLLTEEEYDFSAFPNQDKIHQFNIHQRLTYELAFNYSNNWPEPGIWILSNADIYFDDSLSHVRNAKLDNVVFALTRHDVQTDGTLKMVHPAFAHGSQDAWIFKTPISLVKLFANFYLGIPGCDNRIAHEFINAGYKVLNPSKMIIICHLDLIRNTDVFERDKEYATLMTQENINKGLAAPPPYQYHLYPVDQTDPDSIEIYKFYLAQLSRITELQAYKSKYEDLLQSWSWKITLPLRVVSDLIKKICR